ncbi:peptidoglycan DD-metalloendopeptidase family protein [bacterium]|nr:peptidoglycan DD-metalloendopeptidase family protein [bacterium]
MFSNLCTLINRMAQVFIPFFWQEVILSSILFLIVLTLTLVFRKQSPFLRLGLWALLLVRLIVPTDLTFSYSGSQLLHQITGFGKRLNMQQISLPIESDLEQVTERIPESSAPVNLTYQNQIEKSHLTQPARVSPSGQKNLSISFILFSGWILGVVILLFLYLRRLITYHRVIAAAVTVEENDVWEIFEYWKNRFKIKRSIRLVSSSVDLSPFTMGIIKPVVFLPQMLLQSQDKDTIESVIAHEMAHVKHFDDLWIKIQGLIQMIYFFHPVVWIANSRIHLLRECLCDRVVLSSKSLSPDVYGKGLLSVLKLNLFGPEMVELLPCFGNLHKKLRLRVENIKNGKSLGKKQIIFRTILLLAIGLFLLPMGVRSRQDVQTGNESEPASVQHDVLIQIDEEDEPSAPLSTVSEYQEKTSDFIEMIDLFLRNINLGKSNGAFWMKMPGFKDSQVLALFDGIVVSEGPHNLAHPDSGRDIYIQNEAGYTIVYRYLDNVYVGLNKKIEKWEPLGYLNETDKDTLSAVIYFGNSGESKDNQFISPVWNATVISKFGYRLDPFTREPVHHDAVDLLAQKWTSVFASSDGRVLSAGFNKVLGNNVILEHQDGFETCYAHLDSVLVSPGQDVLKGERIGLSGNTGRAEGYHLHFEIRKDGEPVDPQLYIDF